MKELLNPQHGPPAVGPYSPAVKAAGLLFVSGQIPIEPGTGEILSGPIEAQVRRVMENLKILLDEAGTTFEKVVKVSVFLSDLGNFEAMNGVYSEYFGRSKPARSTVEVSKLPKGVDVEIDLIALVD